MGVLRQAVPAAVAERFNASVNDRDNGHPLTHRQRREFPSERAMDLPGWDAQTWEVLNKAERALEQRSEQSHSAGDTAEIARLGAENAELRRAVQIAENRARELEDALTLVEHARKHGEATD